MVSEHDWSGKVLHELWELANGYMSPADGCATYEALYRGLEGFKKYLHSRIHLKNNILFPRAVDLEVASVWVMGYKPRPL